MVAREFRGGSASSEETFSPTNLCVPLNMLAVISAIHNLCMAAFDISNVFLQVEQKEAVLIEVPSCVRVLLNKPSSLYWRLKKCLPGQRNAALR